MHIGPEKEEKLIEAINTYQDLLKLKDSVQKKIQESKEYISNSDKHSGVHYSAKLKEQENLMSKLDEEIEGWRQISFSFVSAFPVGRISDNLVIEDNVVANSPSGNVRERIAICKGAPLAKFTYLESNKSKPAPNYFGAN